MPPFPEKESNGILNLLKKKRPGRVPNNPGMIISENLFTVEFWNTQWTRFRGLKTGLAISLKNNLIRLMPNEYPPFRNVRVWGIGEAKRAVWGEWGGGSYFLTQIYLYKYSLSVWLFVRLLYTRTAPEPEFIVNKEFGVISVQNSLTALPYLSPTEELQGRKLVFKTLPTYVNSMKTRKKHRTNAQDPDLLNFPDPDPGSRPSICVSTDLDPRGKISTKTC